LTKSLERKPANRVHPQETQIVILFQTEKEKNLTVMNGKKIEKEQDTMGERSEESDDDEGGEEISLIGNVMDEEEFTFVFNDMKEDYTEGICVILKTLFPNPTDAYSVACSVTAQSIVGTAILCEDSTDSFAYGTIIPWATALEVTPLNDTLQQLLSSMNSLVSRSSTFDSIQDCCVRKAVGVMLHQRFTNLPIQLIPSLHSNLLEDIGWARKLKEGDEGSEGGSYLEFKSLQYVLLLSKCNLEGGTCPLDVTGNSSLLFDSFEDECYAQSADVTILFQASRCQTNIAASWIPVTKLEECVRRIEFLCSST